MRSGFAVRSLRPAYRPSMEALEDRNCPTGMTPTINFMVATAGPMLYTLSGSVMDEAPAGLSVDFTGVYTGSAMTDANGSFSVNVTPSRLGTITANVTDNEGLSATPVQRSVTSAAPTITLSASRQVANLWVFSGTVTDEYAADLLVRFGNLPSLEGKTATVAANGTYSLTVELAQGEEGTACAQLTDWWGLGSNVAEYIIAPSA